MIAVACPSPLPGGGPVAMLACLIMMGAMLGAKRARRKF